MRISIAQRLKKYSTAQGVVSTFTVKMLQEAQKTICFSQKSVNVDGF